MLLQLYLAVVAMLFAQGAAAARTTSSDLALDDPSRPIRWVVPQPPGGASDTMARVVGQKLAEHWERPVVIDTVAGRIQVCYGSSVAVIPFIRSGKLRALAVTSARRSKSLQAIPTIAESGYPDFDVAPWFGILVRAGASCAETLTNSIIAGSYRSSQEFESLSRIHGRAPASGGDSFARSPRALFEYQPT